MKFWLGVTDNGWYDFLAGRGLDEVNFWQPSASPPFTKAPTGMPFLFKLKRPNNHIAGGGFFVTYSTLPIALAWEVFGEKNGAATLEDLRRLLGPLTGNRRDGEIGCTVLANPFFLDKASWIKDPAGWASNIVRGKMYESGSRDGEGIWHAIASRFRPDQYSEQVPAAAVAEAQAKYGLPVLVKPRLGQSSFRVLVTDAYKRRCAITGENTLLALEAAHIVPYANEGSHDVRNGLLLRADFHRLFDVGLVGVTPDLRIRISPRIREAYFNGKAYYRMNDQQLSVVPDLAYLRPDPDRLNWHLQNRFQA
ncbi:HNH endonuclease [Lysobacter sp. D1-1-M9]|uniref:HNH endonuclease n=2 Tax=Novilysobacter TaxID=3382699 RepID=UPI002FCA175F